ncbi:hypothetical protein TNCT_409361 [Trichonephila clavata]|uniref:Uncharacterized protein n=1 Tax=Trichonephila clavata TaxID=2740835 RepID=A0A8X6FUA6_TRICU|nr:hypothetical protein TNCT_409361 [Trichonephila clavata]
MTSAVIDFEGFQLSSELFIVKELADVRSTTTVFAGGGPPPPAPPTSLWDSNHPILLISYLSQNSALIHG